MQGVHMYCVSLSIYLSIYPFIYLHIFRYVCLYVFIYHSIYLSLYMMIIKRYCFQIEQLKFWQKQNILYFENDVICCFMVNIYFNWHFFVTPKVYIITIKWHNFQSEHRWRLGKNRGVLHSENYVILLRNIDFNILSLHF